MYQSKISSAFIVNFSTTPVFFFVFVCFFFVYADKLRAILELIINDINKSMYIYTSACIKVLRHADITCCKRSIM